MRTSLMVVPALLLAAVASSSPGPASSAAVPAPAASAAPAPAYFQIELAPSGSMVVIGTPVVKGTTMLVHGYPDGKLMSIRKSDVRNVSAITAQEAAAPAARKNLVRIGNLAMQGGSAPAAGGGSTGRPATSSAGAIVHGPQGAALIPSRDGVAVTTDAAHASAHGPSVVPIADGVAVTTGPPR